MNQFHIGDWVTIPVAISTADTGLVDGFLWQVTFVNGNWLIIEPGLAASEPIRMYERTIHCDRVKPVDIIALGTTYIKLANIIRDVVASRSVVEVTRDDEEQAGCTCPHWWFHMNAVRTIRPRDDGQYIDPSEHNQMCQLSSTGA